MSQPAHPSHGVSDVEQQQQQQRRRQQVASEASPSISAGCEFRAKSIAELRQEVADMELILNQRLATHNALRRTNNLPEQQPEQIVSEYIALLTQYNKVKDSAQLVFDKIADVEQLPAKDIHARYGVRESEPPST